MQAEFCALAEALAAAVDSAHERRLERVRVLVLLFELRQREGFVAEPALVGLDARVREYVARERVLRAEGLLAVGSWAREFTQGVVLRVPTGSNMTDRDHT